MSRGNGGEPETLDPQLMTGHPEFNIAWAIFEGLAILDPKTLEPKPGVAESWEVSPDGLSYKFRLRPNAKWSNGDPVTAQDFLFAWQRILTPGLGASYAEAFDCIENARDFRNGTLKDFSKVGVSAPEPLVLQVKLAKPTPHFLFMQALPYFSPIHAATIHKFGAIDNRDGQWTRPGNLVSNGPFRLAAWEPNRIVRIEKNPNYWDAANVRLDAVDFHPIQSLQTEERAFRTGRIDITNSLAPNKIEVYQRDKPELLHIDPYYGNYFYRFNTTKPPLNDPRVRLALAMAIDKADIVKNVSRGGQIPAESLVPTGAGYVSTAKIPYDVEGAKKLLAEAGFPDGKGFPALSFLYNTNEGHQMIAQAIQNMWKKNLGVNITLQNQDWKVYLNSVKELNYEIARGSWIGDYIDPNSFLELFTSTSAQNRTGYKNPAYDALIEQASKTIDKGERFEILQKAEGILMHDAPIAPIYYYTNVYLMNPRVKGFESNLLNYPLYKGIWIEEGK